MQFGRAAETALLEFKSSKILIDHAKRNGFNVEEGVAGIKLLLQHRMGPVDQLLEY